MTSRSALYRALAPYDWASVLRLIQAEFAYMDGLVDPPSSMLALTSTAIARQAVTGEVWVAGTPTIACVFLTPQADALHISKLAVALDHRGQGLARALLDKAADRARVLHLPALTLQTRVELVENHAAFAALGFVETGRSAHSGFHRPTTVNFRKRL